VLTGNPSSTSPGTNGGLHAPFGDETAIKPSNHFDVMLIFLLTIETATILA